MGRHPDCWVQIGQLEDTLSYRYTFYFSDLFFVWLHCDCVCKQTVCQTFLFLLFFFFVEIDPVHQNAAAPTATRSHSLSTWMCWGPAAGLAVGVRCLAIPLAGGVRPLWVGLGQPHAECCSEPLQKHLGYLLPSKQSFPYGSVTSFSNFPFFGSGGFVFLSQRLWFQCSRGTSQTILLFPVHCSHFFFLLWMLKHE